MHINFLLSWGLGYPSTVRVWRGMTLWLVDSCLFAVSSSGSAGKGWHSSYCCKDTNPITKAPPSSHLLNLRSKSSVNLGAEAADNRIQTKAVV